MRILLVEDDFNLAETLAEAITDQRYMVDVADDGESALNHIKVLDYDLILLDVMLPDLNGMVLCEKLRSQGHQMPILMITALDTISDKITGLDAGADDYIIKPVDLGELFARIRALLRRGNTSLPPILEWGQLQFNPSTYEVSYGERPIHLTPKEYSILELLLRNGRRVLSRSVIIDSIWSLETPPDEDTVKVHIRSLRQKLKKVGASGDFIETVHGLGYRLNKVEEKVEEK